MVMYELVEELERGIRRAKSQLESAKKKLEEAQEALKKEQRARKAVKLNTELLCKEAIANHGGKAWTEAEWEVELAEFNIEEYSKTLSKYERMLAIANER